MDMMQSVEPLAFTTPGIGPLLAAMSNDELNALPFGVVEMDHEFRVLRYNTAESRHSGLPPERVVGRHFFREVAPCADNRHVSHRYAQPALDESVPYTFLLLMKPAPVTLRMFKTAAKEPMYLLVDWS
jgi:photoactive yellow protein